MSSVLFNLNDMTLIMTIVMSVLFCVMLLSSHKMRDMSAYLLASFMAAHAFIAIHELTFYGVQFRYEVIENFPNLLMLGSLAYCIDAIILYFYVKSVVYKDFKFTNKHYIYLLPLIIYLIYLLRVYYRLDFGEKQLLQEEWLLANSWHFVVTETAIKVMRLGFVIGALLLIDKYHKRHKELRSDISAIDLNWLNLLLLGFMLIMLAEVALGLIKVVRLYTPIEDSVLITLGVSTYYATFLLIVFLLFYSATKSPSIVPISYKDTLDEGDSIKAPTAPAEQSAFQPEYTKRIERFMAQEKPYLISDITIEVLADKLGVSAKDLSVTLNRYFQLNFYEFINHYRINAAKELLVNDKNKPITDIFYEVGFNSKSVFYTFFKKKEGITPSEYRKQHTNS